LNNKISTHFFTLKFDDKAEWNNFKEDLKSILRENGIKYQYSEKVPTFHILYKSEGIKLRIDWQNDNLFANLHAIKTLTDEIQVPCNEIFELLTLFEGKLIDGNSPYDW
jgi:hypothetical protein